jgi:cell division protein FtsI (penicillin-binding protein 3)
VVKNKNGLLLGGAALLGATSLWLLAFPDDAAFRGLSSWPFVFRQGVFGLLALALAWGIGRFSLHRQLLQYWYLPPVLMLLIMIAAPITAAAALGRFVCGYGWWTRSIGVIAAFAAQIGGLVFALPRCRKGRRGGTVALAAVLIFTITVPLFFLQLFGELFIFTGTFVFACTAVLTGRKRIFSLLAAGISLAGTVFFLMLSSPARTVRIVAFLDPERHAADSAWQLVQAFASICSGGWIGGAENLPRIPEWHTDFIFARLCAEGGLIGGFSILLLAAALALAVWRIVRRQSDPQARTLAAGCAAPLMLYPLLHLLVNTGLFPTKGIYFPFLSYGPLMMLFCGVFLGLLISLAREDSSGSADRIAMLPVVLTVFLLAVIAIRLMLLMLNPPSSVEYIRAKQQERIERQQAEQKRWIRGRILDCNGSVLAQNGTNFILCADPSMLADSTETNRIADVARLAGLDEGYIRQRIADRNRRYVRLRKYLPAETAQDIKRMYTSGFFLDKEPARDYPIDTPLAHLVGIVHLRETGLIGAGGLEMVSDSVLDDGQDVTLTLYAELQTAVQRIAETAADEAQSKQVQIIVMNPETGAIRAAVQVPAVHGENSATAEAGSLNWRAVIDVFEPGGLIMPLVVASALESGVITSDARIDCENGTWDYFGFPLRDAAPFGNLTPEEILIRSSNIGMAKIGLMMGKQSLYDSLLKWRLTKKCSVGGFGGAPTGLLDPPARWSELEITRIPIGHSCAFSLLQIVRAYTAFFNDGKMVEPYLIETGTPADATPVLKPETATVVRNMLASVVENGTGQAARLDGVPMFGKTAVIQKLTPDNRGYSSDKVQTAVMGGFEKEGIPVLIAVWLDEPEREAKFNPAPQVFRKVASALLTVGGTGCTH